MKNLETEYKWDASFPRAFKHIGRIINHGLPHGSVGESTVLSILDVYLDTPQRNLEKQKVALRVRCQNGKFELTLKTRTQIINGKAQRKEYTLPLPNVKTLREAMAFIHQKKSWKGVRLEEVAEIFRIKNKRRLSNIKIAHSTAELCLDECVIFVCGRQLKMKEVELEITNGKACVFEALVNKITAAGFKPARISKVASASALLNLWGEK